MAASPLPWSRVAPPLALGLLLALLPPAANAQGGPTYFQPPYGSYSRATANVFASGRFQHVAAATGPFLVLAGGQAGSASNVAAGTALPTDVMTTAAPETIVQSLLPALTGLDQLVLPMSGSAFDAVFSIVNGVPAAGSYLLAYGGADFTGTATPWLSKLDFATRNWTWISTFALASAPTTMRTSAAAAYLRTCYFNDTSKDKPCFLVWGGLDNYGTVLATADILRLVDPNMLWQAAPAGLALNAPLPRFDHSLTASYDGTTAYMFGGSVSGQAAAAATAAAGACTQSVSNELWQLAPAGFADAQPSEMVNVILDPSYVLAPIPTLYPPVPDALTSGPPGLLIDGTALDGVANTAKTPEFSSVVGYNRCVFTTSANQPFVRIDMRVVRPFTAVSLYGQTDCASYSDLAGQQLCLNRMQGVEVYTSDTAPGPAATPWLNAVNLRTCDPPASPQLQGGRVTLACSGIPAAGARYIWIVLPSPNNELRSIGLCEVQALSPQRWAWRQLSGQLFNAALGKAAGQTSTASSVDGVFAASGQGQQLLGFAEASRAVDGVTSNDARSQSCAVTDCDGDTPCVTVVPGAFQEWRVNLGTTTSVQTIKFWPAIFDGEAGALHGGPGVLPNRTRQWYVTAGFSQNPSLNMLCGGAPVDVSAPNLDTDGSMTLPCVTEALYVAIRKYSGGIDGTGSDGDDAVSVCEVQVWADKKLNTPSARAGHAAAGFRGHLLVWGGYDSSGSLLNDLHMYSMLYGTWWDPIMPLGVPPSGRSYSVLTPYGPNAVALSGGIAAGQPMSDVTLVTFTACRAVPADGSYSNVVCSQQGSACYYTCNAASGFTFQNGALGGWLVCLPTGGYAGPFPPCMRTQPVVPSANPPISVNATAALVSWTAAQPLPGPIPLTYYAVYTKDASGKGSYYDIFEDGPTAIVPTNYVWWDPSANLALGHVGSSAWSVPGTNLQIVAAPGSECYTQVAGKSGCPYLALNSWPNGLDPNSEWVIETQIQLGGSSLNVEQAMAGIGIVEGGLLQFIVGLEYIAPSYYVVWQSFRGTAPNGAWRQARRLDLSQAGFGVSLFVKLEHSQQTNNRIQAFYKLRALDSWSPMRRPAALGDFILPPTTPANWQPAMAIRNYQQAITASSWFEAAFDYFRVDLPTCSTPGQTTIVPATAVQATVVGLTPGRWYEFDIVASTDPLARDYGVWGAEFPTVPVQLPPQAPSIPPLATLVEVAMGRPSFLLPATLVGSRAGLANDGNISTSLYGPYGIMQCAATPVMALPVVLTPAAFAQLQGPMSWTVDLGTVTDVELISIFIAGDANPASLDGFQVYLTTDAAPTAAPSSYARGESCVTYNKPYSLNTPGSYNATFLCDASGRFVTVYVPAAPGLQLAICEVQVFSDNFCPNRASANAISSPGCSGAGGTVARGSVCTQTCQPGFVAAYGTSKANATCQGETWSTPAVVCQPGCPVLPAPVGSARCQQTFVRDLFVDSYVNTIAHWQPADRRQAFTSAWFYDPVNYRMEATARKGCLDDMLLLSTHYNALNIGANFVLEGALKARDAGGFAFRVLDAHNYYRVVMDPRGQSLSIQLVLNNDVTTIASRSASWLRQDIFYRIKLFVNGPNMAMLINAWDGGFGDPFPGGVADALLVVEAVDNTLTSGSTGLYAETWAIFQYFVVTGDCQDQGQCAGGVSGDACAFTCRAGMTTVNGARTCFISSPTTAIWSGVPQACTAPPPIFRRLAISCFEFSPLDSQCGDALEAESLVSSLTVNYAIASGNTNNAFYIDQCSGILRVANPNALDIALVPGGVFSLIVNASLVGVPGSTTQAIVTVKLLRAVDAPVVAPVQTFLMPENAKPSSFIAMLNASNVDPAWPYDAIRWSLDSALDGAASLFRLSAAGALSVAPPPTDPNTAPPTFNFEGVPSTYTLFVHASRISHPDMQASGTVFVQLVDTDDAPYVDPGLFVQSTDDVVIFNRKLSPVLSVNVRDPDSNAAFRSPVLQPLYSLKAPSSWAALKPYEPCALANAAAYSMPTVDGTANGLPLFSIDQNTGELTIIAVPSPPVSTNLPFAAFGSGLLADAIYYVCVVTSDNSLPAVNAPTTQQLVPIVFRPSSAKMSAQPAIYNCSLPPATSVLNTSGFQIITCTKAPTPAALPTNIIATYYSTSGPFVSFNATCTFDGASTVTCTTSPGVGANLLWSFADATNADAGIAVYIPFVTSYAPPFAYSLTYSSAPARPNTTGGDMIVIAGDNFGTGTGASSGYSVLVQLWPPRVQGSRGPIATPYVCAYIPPSPSSVSGPKAIQCMVPAGAGSGLQVILTIGNAVYVPGGIGPGGQLGLQLTFRYAAPVLVGLTGPGAPPPPAPFNNATAKMTGLSPAGNQVINVYGSNFGPGLQVTETTIVSFGGADGRLETLLACTHNPTYPHTLLRCVTPPTVGANLAVRVNIAGQESALSSGLAASGAGLSFVGPSISSVTGPGALSASTSGNQQILVTGTNFPPVTVGTVPLQPIVLFYGPGTDVTRYVATQCIVTKATPAVPTIQCLSSAGTGKLNSWMLVIAGVATPVFTGVAQSYQAPIVTAVGGPASLPAGGVTTGIANGLVITGQGFGPNTPYTNTVLQVMYTFTTPQVGDQPMNFKASGCRITVAQTQITCNTVAGVGAGLAVFVTVNGLAATPATISYAAPVLTGILLPGGTSAVGVPLGDPNQLYTLTLLGRNFGPPQVTSYIYGSNSTTAPAYDPIQPGYVTFGETGVEDVVPTFTHVSDTQLTVTVGQGAGGSQPQLLSVRSGNQVSAPNPNVTFQFAACVTSYFSPASADTFSLDFAPTIVNMWVTNVPFLDDGAELVVCFGVCVDPRVPAPLPANSLVDNFEVLSIADLPIPGTALSVTEVFNLQNADGSYNLTFTLPLYYSGALLPISLAQKRGTHLEIVMPATPATTFSYNPPEIYDVVVSPVKWQTSDPNCAQCGLTGYNTDTSGINAWGPNPNAFCANAAQQANCTAKFGGAVFCPLPLAGVPNFQINFKCSNAAKIYKVVVLGKNFRASARELSPIYNYMEDGVKAFVEIYNAGELNRTANRSALVGTWEPNPTPAWPLALGALRTGTLPNAQGCPYFPSFSCSYRASNNTFQFNNGWGNYRIELYTTLPAGTVRVRLVSLNKTACLDPPALTLAQCCNKDTGIGRGCITQWDERAYSTLSPTVGALSGDPTGFPTAGNSTTRLLTMLVDQLQGATNLAIFVGDNVSMPATLCPLAVTDANGVFKSMAVDAAKEIVQAQQGNLQQGQFWLVSCVVPAGQGQFQPVHLVRYIGALQHATDNTFTVSYAPPVIQSVSVMRPNFMTSQPPLAISTTYSGSVIMAPTASATLRVYGTNLGSKPVINMAAGPAILAGPATLYECPATTVTTSFVGTHTCYEFKSLAGVGNSNNGVGFAFNFSAGNQFHANNFSYQVPFSFPLTPLPPIPVVATKSFLPTSGDPSINLTITGCNFGAVTSKGAVTVAFGYQSDGPSSFIPCAQVIRKSQTQIVCVGLPKGSGSNLEVMVTVAGLTGYLTSTLTYSRPIITEAYAVVFLPDAIEPPAGLCEYVYTEKQPDPEVNTTNWNVTVGNRLAIPQYVCVPDVPGVAPPSVDASANATANVTVTLVDSNLCVRTSQCTGYGYDVATGLIKSSSYVCNLKVPPPSPTLNVTLDARFAFSTTLKQTIQRAITAGAIPSSISSITSITGGRLINASGFWQLIPSSPTGSPVNTTGPLLLHGPSRAVTQGPSALQSTVLIVIVGSSFGPGITGGDPFSCGMLPWAYRNRTRVLACNGIEDFLGEGERASGNVAVWDDTKGVVAFLAGPGVGVKDVEVVVRRNTQQLPLNSTLRVNFLYDAPMPLNMQPGEGLDTDGGLAATLVVAGLPNTALTPSKTLTSVFYNFAGCNAGCLDSDVFSNCALPQANTPCPCVQSPCLVPALTSIPMPTGAISLRNTLPSLVTAAGLPTATMVVVFSNQNGDFAFLSDAYRMDGSAGEELTNICTSAVGASLGTIKQPQCLQTTFDRSVAGELTFFPPKGVGSTVYVRIDVYDGPPTKQVLVASSAFAGGLVTNPTVQVNAIVQSLVTSNSTYNASDALLGRCDNGICTSGYLAPNIINTNPTVVLLDDGRTDTYVDFIGYNFGSSEIVIAMTGPEAHGAPSASCDGSGTALGMVPSCLMGFTGSSISSNNGSKVAFVNGSNCLSSDRIEPVGVNAYIHCKVNSATAFVGVQQPFVMVGDQINLPRGYDSFLDMIIGCKPGFFAPPGSACIACPVLGATCKGYDATIALLKDRTTRPVAQPGFFDYNTSYGGGGFTNRPQPTDKRQPHCPFSVQLWPPYAPQATAPPEDVCIFPCPSAGACLGANVCAQGYESVAPYYRCATCAQGYYMRAGQCSQCPSAALAVLIGYVLAIVLTITLAWLFSKYEVHVALLSLGVDFTQTVAMLAWSKVQWDPSVRSLFFVLSATYLDVEIVAPECYDGYELTSFRDKFFAVLWLPVAIAVALFLTHCCVWAYTVIVKGAASSRRMLHVPALLSCGLLVASLLYMYETENLLQVFNCAPLSYPTFDAMYKGIYPVPFPQGPNPNITNDPFLKGPVQYYADAQVSQAAAQVQLAADSAWQAEHVIKYLHLAPEECAAFGPPFKGTQGALLPYAILFLILGVAGWPLTIAWWLHKNRMLIMEDQLLRAKGQGGDRLSGPNTYVFRKTWGRLYYQFKPELWFWQVVLYLRKFTFLTVMLVAWNENGAFQMVGCAAVLLCFYVLHVRMSPFMGPDTYEEVLRDHNNQSITSALHARLRAAIQDVEAKGKRGVRKPVVDFNGKINRNALLGAVLAALFDYNTVEAVLLFSAIMICLLGVVTDVHVSYYGDAPTSASAGIITLVSATLIYFSCVAVWDTLLAAAAKATADAETRRRRTSKSGRNMSSMTSRKAARSSESEDPEDGPTLTGFHARARGLVDRFTSDEARRASDAVRRSAVEAESVSAPVEVSVNPLMMQMEAAAAAKAGSSRSLVPDAGAGLGPASSQGSGPVVAPGDLEALQKAIMRHPGVPPLELWHAFRSSFGDAVRTATSKDGELSDLKVRVADQESLLAQLHQELAAAQASPQQSVPAPVYAAASPLQRAESMRQFASTADRSERLKAMKPSPRPVSGRSDFAPVSAVSAGTGASWRGAPAPPPPQYDSY